jgi:Icc-related predicted phosphoesterase
MKIQYCSDLHLEFIQNFDFLQSNKIIPKADILILAGDIFLFFLNIENEKYFDFLSNSFKEIYWLPGNHEYYKSDIIRYHKYKEKKIRPNIHVVRNEVVSFNGINLIFSTLWGNISPKNELYIKSHVSDFNQISYNGEGFKPNHFNQLHVEAKAFLEKELQKRQSEKNIVITHHVPTLFNYPEEYKNSPLNEAFAVEMYDFIEKYQPEAWIYGHSHVNTPEFKIGKTRMLTNQLGYVVLNEHKTFKLDAFIDI